MTDSLCQLSPLTRGGCATGILLPLNTLEQCSASLISNQLGKDSDIVITIHLSQTQLATIAEQGADDQFSPTPPTGEHYLFVGSVNGGHERFEYTQTLFTEATYYLPALEQILNSSDR